MSSTTPYVKSIIEPGSWNIYNKVRVSDDMDYLKLDPYNSFCNSYSGCNSVSGGRALDKQCNNLTEYNCNRVGCCVFTSNNKCEAGGPNGATYSPNIDYYYYKNKSTSVRGKCPQ